MRTLPASSRGLRPNGSVGLVDDDLAVRHLRRTLEDPLELLVAHPLGCDTRRLVGLRRGVEEADRAHDALAGVDQEVAAEAGQLAQTRRQTLADLLRQLVLVARVALQRAGVKYERPEELVRLDEAELAADTAIRDVQRELR